MRRAVSVSLGSPARDKRVIVHFGGQPISIERIGTGGDAVRARQLFAELDGQVDALSVGGIDLYVRLDGRDYPIHAALKLVQDVRHTPLVDGRVLKYVLERRVFELVRPVLGEIPDYHSALMPTAIDRIGLAEAVTAVSDSLVIGDLVFTLGIPIPVRGLGRFKRLAKVLLPAVGFLPMGMLYPPGSKDEGFQPKHLRLWREAELIAGDMHYIRKYSPDDLGGKTVITNTTTAENMDLLRARGVKMVMTLSPRFEGRSFGTNLMEAVLTAFAGLGRPLTAAELNALIDRLDLRPDVQQLTR